MIGMSDDIPVTCPTCGPGWAKLTHYQKHTIHVFPDRREAHYDCEHTVIFPPKNGEETLHQQLTHRPEEQP